MALEAQTTAQLEDHRQIHQDHKQTYQLMGGVTLVVIGIWIGAQLFGSDAGFTTNLYTEALSVLVTVLVIKWFDDRRATNQRKQALFLQLGSQSNDFALEAKRQLEMEEGWLEKALAQKWFPRAGWQEIELQVVDLTDAVLFRANLTNSDLRNTNLTGAKLMHARLTGAKLWNTILISADLSYANLSNAELWNAKLRSADLSNANLTSANLHMADLTGAILIGANLHDAHYTDYTILPDGTRWKQGTYMTRFTHPSFSDLS